MGVYILDALRFKEGAFAAVWASLGLANLATIMSTLLHDRDQPVVLTILTILINGATLFLTGEMILLVSSYA